MEDKCMNCGVTVNLDNFGSTVGNLTQGVCKTCYNMDPAAIWQKVNTWKKTAERYMDMYYTYKINHK